MRIDKRSWIRWLAMLPLVACLGAQAQTTPATKTDHLDGPSNWGRGCCGGGGLCLSSKASYQRQHGQPANPTSFVNPHACLLTV
ncbi:MAG: hypothetical protein ACKOXN_16285 [Limnohabitans sp.]